SRISARTSSSEQPSSAATSPTVRGAGHSMPELLLVVRVERDRPAGRGRHRPPRFPYADVGRLLAQPEPFEETLEHALHPIGAGFGRPRKRRDIMPEHARVVIFEADAAAIDAVVKEIQTAEGPPPGINSTRISV